MAITDDLCRSWFDLTWHFDPAAAAADGVDPGARRLGDFTRANVHAHVAAARAIGNALEELPVGAIEDEIDRTALLGEIRHHAARLEEDAPHLRDPCFWLEHLGHALLPFSAPEPDRGPAPADLLACLQAVPDYLSAARDTLRRPSALLAEAAAAMAGCLSEEIHILVEAYGPPLADSPGELAGAATDAAAALTRLHLALGAELAPDEDPHGVAIGEERFSWMLQHHFMVRPSAGEIWRWGHTLAEAAEAAVAAAAGELDPARDWREVFEEVREEGLITGDLLAAATVALAQARDGAMRHGVLPPLGGEVEVCRAPAWLAMQAPVSWYAPPPARGDSTHGRVYLAAPTDPTDAAGAAWQRGELDYYRLAVLAAHQGWPGRQAQASAARATRSEARRLVRSPVMVAGWGSYAAAVMAEQGALGDAPRRLAHQVMELLAALRLVVDVGLHTRQLTPSAAVDLLLARAPVDHPTAVAEVRRCGMHPGEATAAAVGRVELDKLRDDWRRVRGIDGAGRAFHEAVLGYGRLPISLVRWGLDLDG